jgi:hypothetical protein
MRSEADKWTLDALPIVAGDRANANPTGFTGHQGQGGFVFSSRSSVLNFTKKSFRRPRLGETI